MVARTSLGIQRGVNLDGSLPERLRERLQSRYRIDRATRPTRCGPEQALGEPVVPRKLSKERCVFHTREHPADHAIDDRVENEVLRWRHPGEKRRVSQQHMVKFMHHQRQQLLRRISMPLDKQRVDQHPRLYPALDRRRGHFRRFNYVEQPQQAG